MERENKGMEQLVMEGFMQRENGHNKQLLMERVNEGIQQLPEEELFGLIFDSARHIICMDGKYARSKSLSCRFPTELISFPEFKRKDFSLNERFFKGKSKLGINFDEWREKKVGFLWRKEVVPEVIPATTILSITTEISPGDVRAYTIKYDLKSPPPKKIHYFPSISRNSKAHTYKVEKDDLQSFWDALDFALRRVDPQFLLELCERSLSRHQKALFKSDLQIADPKGVWNQTKEAELIAAGFY